MTRLRPVLGLLLLLGGCSGAYQIRLSDDRSASFGQLFFFGWADPPLIPGSRLVDAPPGSRVVLWNEAGLEAVVDLGETCPVLVREGDGARAPTAVELAVIAAVFPAWPLAESARASEYTDERRLERRFPSHILDHVRRLDPPAMVSFALGDAPSGWLALGGRAKAMTHAAPRAPVSDVARLIDAASALRGSDRDDFLRALAGRKDLASADLVKIARMGGAILAARHALADEAVCLAAVEEVAKEPLSSVRRSGLEAILESPGATPAVRAKVLEVPLAYPEDRDAVRAKAGVK
ncbi:MAG TPA: hypothetical protein VJU16_07580 [Planctomycetota bacterium]|nr:hypothetical protein [Planctomycetota bacterium]